MKIKQRLKAALASLMVTLALVGPAMVLSATGDPPLAELCFEAVELRHVMVGNESTVQAIFSVSVEHTYNATGAAFFLRYNPEYMAPSDAKTNQVLSVPVTEACDDFFASDPDLYYTEKDGKKTVVSPFRTEKANGTDRKYTSYIDTSHNVLHMALWLDQDVAGISPRIGVITATGGASGTTLKDGTKIGGKVELLKSVGYDDSRGYVFNCRSTPDDAKDTPAGKVTLGTISFQVNKARLPEILRYFDFDRTRDYREAAAARKTPWVKTVSLDGTTVDTFLLDITDQYGANNDAWTVEQFAFIDDNKDITNVRNLTPKMEALAAVTDRYIFHFDGKTIVDVEATDPDVTINAYQNFTYGKKDDLPLTMGRYSPTVTITYADGTKENVAFPWGLKGTDGKYKDGYTVKQQVFYTQADVDAWTPPATDPTATCPFAAGDEKDPVAVTDGNYDPTHGVYYFSQLYTWTTQEPDATSATGYKTVKHTFTKPVTAKLTVTPITVIDVTAEDMERSYNLSDVVSQVTSANALFLPEEARIITDIVPSGVSLVTPIKGWRPVQPASAPTVDPDGTPNSGDEYVQRVSTWPANTSTGKELNSLKADSYVMPGTYPTGSANEGKNGYPYWPDVDDTAFTTSDPKPERYVGTYTFETSQGDHATKENILSADIQRAFPWLTIPFKPGSTTERVKEWDVGQAHRNILSREDYEKQDPSQYEVTWVSTVTEATGNGVYTPGSDSHPNGIGQPTLTLQVSKKDGDNYTRMTDDSVFRVWLPNGQELGTGLNTKSMTVENWFNYSGETDPTKKADHVNGYYYIDPAFRAAPGGRYFRLVTNPDQPEVNEHGTQRETLRRYINLGGWYSVAICENPNEGLCGAHNDGGGTACPDTSATLQSDGTYKCDICGEVVTATCTSVWTPPIPVYVPPRRNEYTESKIYNFIGENVGLYNWPGGVEDTLYLPRGEYTPVSPLNTAASPNAGSIGRPVYLPLNGTIPVDLTDGVINPAAVFTADDHNVFRILPGVERYEESYGVHTIYDGQTGAQPGVTYTVRVNKKDTTHTANWASPTNAETLHATVDPGQKNTPVTTTKVWKYGPTPLYEGIDQDGDGKLDGYAIAGFGRVFQPVDDPATTTEDESKTYRATLRRQAPEKPAESVRIKLLSNDDEGITRVVPNTTPGYKKENVTLVTYDTKQEGYTVRQTFTLTIQNVGTTDIYGLDIDSVTDGYDLKDNGDGTRMLGGHFEMLQPPASFLPVGATTTFTLTYIYDLAANEDPNTLIYRDTLYITANGHNDPGKGHTHDTGALTDQYLLDFDAEFSVSKSPLHKVDVIYKPTNGNMGTANLVVGEQGTSAANAIMVYTPTTRTYPEKDLVYVVVNKVDEYEIKSMTAVIDGTTVNLLQNNKYKPNLFSGDSDISGFFGTAETDPKQEVYVFKMPAHDVTVYVNFYEPFRSKLRLENLIDFSTPADVDGEPPVNDLRKAATTEFAKVPPILDHQYKVWRKKFSDAELTAANAWRTATSAADRDYYLMTQGNAIPHGADWPTVLDGDDEGQKFIPGENQYLVVIPADADISQVEAKIRRVVYHEDYEETNTANYPNGRNYEIELDIDMEVYPYNVEKKTDGAYNWGKAAYTSTPVYTHNPTGTSALLGYGPSPAFTGTPRQTTTGVVGGPPIYPPVDPSDPSATSDSSVHTTVQFPSPDQGESKYVVITLSGIDPANPAGGTVYRRYYLEIHRKTLEPQVELHYGNSPYGMIMNEPRFTTEAMQKAAKAAFLEGYTFEGGKRTVVPEVVFSKHKDMQHVIYWREAWARNKAVFEPESLRGYVPKKEEVEVPLDGGGTTKQWVQVFSDTAKTKPVYIPDTSLYDPADNLDLNDYAYFAILGEDMREPGVIRAWDSSGRTVDINKITAVAMDVDWRNNNKGITLLDTTKTLQVDRFKGNTTDFPILDLGVQGRTLTFLAEHAPSPSPTPTPSATVAPTATPSPTPTATPTATAAPSAAPSAEPSASPSPEPEPFAKDIHWPASSKEVTKAPTGGGDPVTVTEYTLVEDIRPGRYAIVYSYTDFDGTTVLKVDRPFVILRGVGDVNTDGVRDSVKLPATGSSATKTDEYRIENRVSLDPLGYEAGGWDAVNKKATDYPYANIFKFRVADVNNDRNINHIDANQVNKNVKDQKATPSVNRWLRFYHPVEYGL